MPGLIAGIHARHVQEAGSAAPSPLQTDTARLSICEVLFARVGHDFSGYKEATFLRRVQRRMQVLGLADMNAYVAKLEADREEAVLLFRDLLIGVTTFFRDAGAFEAVKQVVMPRLFEGKGAGDQVRVWVPGCATGEEAYSLAILLREHMDGLNDVPKRAGVRHRHRRAGHRHRPRRALPRHPAGRTVAGAPGPLLHPAREQLRRRQGGARPLHLLRAQLGAGPAVQPHEPGVLPQPADLHGRGVAGHRHPRLPLLAAARRRAAAGQRGDRRAARRAVRAAGEGAPHLPEAGRPKPPAQDAGTTHAEWPLAQRLPDAR